MLARASIVSRPPRLRGMIMLRFRLDMPFTMGSYICRNSSRFDGERPGTITPRAIIDPAIAQVYVLSGIIPPAAASIWRRKMMPAISEVARETMCKALRFSFFAACCHSVGRVPAMQPMKNQVSGSFANSKK